MCTSESSNYSHKIYKIDPLQFENYVGKEVTVTTEAGTTVSGVVYTVDPVSESVVLLQGREKFDLRIILGHGIKRIDVIGEEVNQLPEMFNRGMPGKLSPAAIQNRKNAVKQLLTENRFPVTENNNVLTIEDILSINPPYNANSCLSSNSIVLSRVQNILSRVKL